MPLQCSHQAGCLRAAARQTKSPVSPGNISCPQVLSQRGEMDKNELGTKAKTGWWITQDHQVYIPGQLPYKMVHQQHELTHTGKTALETLLLLLLNWFSCVRLCATPQMAARQASPSLGFSRQEHWSGLPFPSPVHESEKRK